MSPDSSLIVAVVGWAPTVWDAVTGEEQACLPLPGSIRRADLRRQHPMFACASADGTLYLADLINLEYGPIVVTPVDFGTGFVIRCPYCLALVRFQEEWLDQEMSCPEEGCGGAWKVKWIRSLTKTNRFSSDAASHSFGENSNAGHRSGDRE